MFDVVGCGALNLDLIYRVEDTGFLRRWGMVLGGEVVGDPCRREEFLEDLRREGRFLGRSGGGSAANTTFALARMGFKVGFLGCVGKDREGDFLLGSLDGVDPSGVRRRESSGLCIVVVTPDGERSTVLFPGANDLFRLGGEEVAYASRSRWVHLTSFVGEEAFRAQVRLVEALPDEVSVSLDPGHLYALKGADALKPLLRRTKVLFATEDEVGLLTGEGFREGTHLLGEIGPEVVVVKRGREGAWMSAGGEEVDIPAVEVEVRDPTGAGDVLAAGFLAGLLSGWTPRRCLEFGVGVASRSVEGYGREAYPSTEDLGL
ncbi:MAG TPA: carbohydrate kinase family protein [Candidatus Latescibacteria bacterium]|nr:carbohydrate kinase family protein [Candidatus Latescibacterota bacterium]